ncbi:MAG: indole-3-glycerol phosphate synthase TrpC [Gemmataceae bacterium]|nr:indole-3-glycerol phosphate synthase TrpC [Gemmataceae bacterium]
MSDILQRIVETKHREIAEAKARLPLEALRTKLPSAPPVRDFFGALDRLGRLGIIAEIKKASPSAGVMRADFDPIAIAREYAQHGVDCISVLTDVEYFQGKLEYLTAIRHSVATPVLRKDFLIDPYQVVEARVAGADAVLLIAEILDDEQMRGLLSLTHELEMTALVELYEPANVSRVVASGAKLIGVNNRNLRTFETRLDHTIDLALSIPKDRLLVAESGIRTREDMERLAAAGVRAVLIGESFMRSGDLASKLREIRGDA